MDFENERYTSCKLLVPIVILLVFSRHSGHMYADRGDRDRHDNGPDRQEERNSAYVRDAFDILVDVFGGPTRKHGLDIYEQGFRRNRWR